MYWDTFHLWQYKGAVRSLRQTSMITDMSTCSPQARAVDRKVERYECQVMFQARCITSRARREVNISYTDIVFEYDFGIPTGSQFGIVEIPCSEVQENWHVLSLITFPQSAPTSYRASIEFNHCYCARIFGIEVRSAKHGIYQRSDSVYCSRDDLLSAEEWLCDSSTE